MRTIAALLFVPSLLFVAGCGDPTTSDPDGGGPRTDTSSTADVGPTSDTPSVSDTGTSTDDAGVTDAGETSDAGDVCSSAPIDYACTGPADCTGGVCIASWCLGPDRDAARWDDCGDGTCDACESPDTCQIDCGGVPTRTGTPTFDPATTITLKLHGLAVSTSGSVDARVYGSAAEEGALEMALRQFAPGLPSGVTDETAPNQLVACEYYGRTAASWLSPAQIAEIEAFDPDGPDALHRYALIVAIFLEHRLELSGATHVAIACHSMGCHVTRYLVEHDVHGLASSGRIARIVTQAGVVNGAGMSELFDNPALRSYAEGAPIRTSDFVHMHPEFVRDEVVVYDHHLREANSPNWAGIYVHHVTGTDPVAAGATGLLRPLDLVNPDDSPNDSILFARDTFFAAVADGNRLTTPGGEHLVPGHTFTHENHPGVEPNAGVGAITAAALFHRRRATITLRSVTLLDDHEVGGGFEPGTFGAPPADLVPEITVRFDPYTVPTFGQADVVASIQTLGHRSAAMFTMVEDETRDVGVVLFDGPVFDGQTTVDVELDVREVDHYLHFGVNELPSGDGSVLASFTGPVTLADGTFSLTGADLTATVEVHVRDVY